MRTARREARKFAGKLRSGRSARDTSNSLLLQRDRTKLRREAYSSAYSLGMVVILESRLELEPETW